MAVFEGIQALISYDNVMQTQISIAENGTFDIFRRVFLKKKTNHCFDAQGDVVTPQGRREVRQEQRGGSLSAASLLKKKKKQTETTKRPYHTRNDVEESIMAAFKAGNEKHLHSCSSLILFSLQISDGRNSRHRCRHTSLSTALCSIRY